MKIKWTFWKLVFAVLMAAGFYSTVVRFTQGLGRSTNLSDQFPWGLWIGFDVLCGVMLAAGGFTLTAAVHILNIKRLRPIVRPTILTAFLGYVLVCVALLFDLGKPYNIWHPLIMRNPHSVMFEVAYCVMLYTPSCRSNLRPLCWSVSTYKNRSRSSKRF
jgi:Ni/Fe-hydrogenase subunit HybB-like protein